MRIAACCALVAIFALLPGATAFAGYADRIAADGPVAFWRLGEAPGSPTAADQTANANTGTFAGGATLGQPGALPGDPNAAVRFDGVDDSISVPDSNSLDATTGVTVEAWVKRTKKAAQVIVGKPGNSTLKAQNYALWLTNANNARAHFGSGSAVVTVVGGTALNTEWHHIVATYDNATARVYVDGVLDGTKTSTVRMAANAQPLSIGREAATAANFFGGTLDEVAVYDKVLTAAQIQAHFLGADITPPVVALTAPAPGSVTNSQTPAYAGTAGTATGDSTTVTVKVYSGTSATGLPVQTLTSTRSGGSWSASSLVPLIDGTYTAQAEQADASGNVGTSAPRTFTVDTAGPAVTLTDPAQGATTTDTTPALGGAAGTATGDGQTVTARIYSGTSATGTPVRTLTATASAGSWTTEALPALSDGTYTAQASQGDAAGNTGTSAAKTFTIDGGAPAVTLTDPADGSSTNDPTPALAGAAGAAAGDGATVTVRIYAGITATGTPVETITTNRTGATWTATAAALADGTYTAQASQDDGAGNTGTSAAHTFGIDTGAPAVTLTDPADGATTGDTTPALAGAAGTATGDGQTITVRIYAGSTATGTPVQTINTNRSGGSWTATASALAGGAYTAQASQGDAAGNTGTSAAHTFSVDSTAPAVTLTDPADGSSSNDSTPALAGAAGDASGDGQTITVRIYAGTTASGTPVETVTTSRSGGGWTATAPALADGTYTVQASQSDTAENTGTSAAHTFSVDTTAPAVTLTDPADGAITNDSTPAFGGAAGSVAGDGSSVTVRVYAGTTATGTPVQTLTTDRTGATWTATAATLADGTYTARATQGDAAANTGTSAAHTFTIDTFVPDTTPPAVTLTQPADGAATNDPTPALSGAAGTDAGDDDAITVRIYAGTTTTGTPVETLTTDRTGASWTATASALADGTYTARASQSDAAGNTGTSATHTFSVDTAAPAVTLTDPAQGTSTSDATPELTGAAGTATGDAGTVTVRVYAGSSTTGFLLRTLTATASAGAWSTDTLTPLPDGTYTAQASQGDAAGNTGTSAAHTFSVDSTAPAVTLTDPADGSSSNDSTPALAGAAGSATGDGATVTVRIFAGATATGTPVQTTTTNRTGATWAATAAALADGTYTAQAYQDDGAGNTGTSAAHTFVIDTSAPAVTLTTPADGATTNDATPALAGAAGTATGDLQTITVRVYAGTSATGTPVQTLTTDRTGATWNATAAALADGTYTARASQSDAAGNVGASTAHTFTIDTFVPDTTPPAVTLTQPADGATGNDPTPALAGDAGTDPGDGSTVTVRIYAGSTATGTPVQTTATSRTGASWTATAAALADGTYTAQASQSDTAGNTGTSAPHTFSVDTAAPAVTLTDPADGSSTNDSTPAFGGAAGSATGDSQTITVRIYAGASATGTPVQTLTPDRTGATWAATAATLADGTYTARATQTDVVGNTGASAAHTFTIDTFVPDTTPPTVTLTSPADGSSTNDATPALSGAAGTDPGDSDAITVRIYAGTTPTGTPVQTRTTDRTGGTWATTASALADGTYTARASQSDAAGNTGTSAAHTFSVDTTAPAVTLTDPAHSATTGDATPQLAGAEGTAAGDGQTITVRVYAGTSTAGFLLRTLTATASAGSWSTEALPALPDGSYTAQASQSDTAGNTGTSAPHTFSVDTAAPAVTLADPADGSSTNDSTPAFSGAAGSAAGDGQTITVRIYAGASATGTPVQTLTPDRTGATWAATASTLADGTYTARASQSDTAGNTGTSAPHTFSVHAVVADTIPPAVTLTAPADGATTSDPTPALAGDAGTDAGDSSTVTVRIYSGPSATGVPVQTINTNRAGGSWAATASTLADGTYTARASQSDASANTGLSAAHTFIVDTAAPSVSVTTPAEGSTTSDRTPTFSGTAGSGAGDAGSVSVRLYAGAVATGTPIQSLSATRGANGAWSVAAGDDLANGTYTVRASQDDAAGNTGTSAAVHFKVGLTYREQVVADGARGYWRFGETSGTVAADLGTSNTPGAYQSGVTLGVPGALANDTNTAARFDGVNDVVNYGDPASGAMDAGTADFSIEFWMKTALNNSQSVLGKQGTSGPYWQLLVTNAAGQVGKLRVSINDGTTLRQTYSSVRVDDNVWHHVVVAFKRTVGIDVYVDGDKSTKAGGLTATLDNTAPFQVGKVTGFPFYKGDLDEVAIYNKYLTAQDVGAHLVATQGPDLTGPGPTLSDPPASGVTDDPKPTFTGKASLAPGDAPGVTVKLWAGSSASGAPLQTMTTTAQASGAWATEATSSLPDGTYTVRAEQADTNGNVGASPDVTFTVSGASASATYRQTVLDDGPAAYWRLRETAGIAVADRAGDSTGTALNGAGLGSAGAIIGDPSAGASFDGLDDELNMGDPASGALDLGTDDFTIEMWVRTTSNATQSLLAKQPASGPLWQLLVTSAPGFVGHVRATFNDGTTQRQGYSAEPIDDGQWHYVAVSVDRDVGMTIYVDDDGAYRNGAVVRSLDNAAPLQVGRVTGFPSLNGNIDEVAIYRRALSATEALHHYTEGTRLEGTTPAPTLTSPTPSQHTTDATPTYSGRAGIVRGDRNPIVINVYDGPSAGGTPRQSVPLNVEPSGEYSLESGRPLPQGTYTAQAEQRDTAGGIGRSAPVTFTVDPATPPDPADPTLLTAGDIAGCSSSGDEATANLLDALPGTIQTLGDNAYESGTAAEFNNCYGPTWGRHKARTKPAVGDHEYLTTNATPYFNYFGAAAGDPTKGYYSYDLGAWHVVVMNTVCDKVSGGCDAGSPQEQWVRADLAAHPTRCAIGVMTEPRYSSGSIHGPGGAVQPLWQALYDNGADIVLTGDDHVYERFAPMTPDGRLDRVRGIRQFTVGTGGHSHTAFGPRQLNSEAGDDATFGVLKLGLHATSYDWDFVPITGLTFTDSGSRSCGS